MARILVELGITKIRLTGGEPLLRKGIVEFVRELSRLRTLANEKPDIAITTNGHLLEEIARPLKMRASTASLSAWTPSIQNSSHASRACPTDSKACSRAFAPPAVPVSTR